MKPIFNMAFNGSLSVEHGVQLIKNRRLHRLITIFNIAANEIRISSSVNRL